MIGQDIMRRKVNLSPVLKQICPPPPGFEAPPSSMEDGWSNAFEKLLPHLDRKGVLEVMKIMDAAETLAQHFHAVPALVNSREQPERGYGYLPKADSFLTPVQQRSLDMQRPDLLSSAANCHANIFPRGIQPTSQSGVASHCSEHEMVEPTAHTAAVVATKHEIKEQRSFHSLSSSLQLLSEVDADRIFVVRRINKFGFKASRILNQHFSEYGPVQRILFAHSTMQQQTRGSAQQTTRHRPSGLAFVQMRWPISVRNILALGGEHVVDGIRILVQKFDRSTKKDNSDLADNLIMRDGKFQRDSTSESNQSVSTCDTSNGSLFGSYLDMPAKNLCVLSTTPCSLQSAGVSNRAP